MNIFVSIINYWKRFFSKQKKLDCGDVKKDVLEKRENTFTDSLQKESKDFISKKNILDEINNNPDLIYSLSYNRLVQLNSLYEERINELERKINEAKSYV